MEKESSNQLIPMLRERIRICYENNKRGTVEYKRFCPTKNIKWHFADPRQVHPFKYKYIYEYFLYEFLQLLLFISDDKINFKKQLHKLRRIPNF